MLPDVNEVYPQVEDKPVQECDNSGCDTGIHTGDEVIEFGGYHYCSKSCVIDQMLKDGHALKITIGG